MVAKCEPPQLVRYDRDRGALVPFLDGAGIFRVQFSPDGQWVTYVTYPAGELRRAYCDGLIFKAVRGRLVSLERVRTPHDVQLLRHELTNDEPNVFITRMGDHLRNFTARLNDGGVEVVGQVPPSADVLGRVRTWLSENNGLRIANAAGVTGY